MKLVFSNNRKLCTLLLCISIGTTIQAQAQIIPDSDIEKITHEVSDQLLANYPFSEISDQYRNKLLSAAKDGSYRNMDDCSLAKRMTTDLRAVHKDIHLQIFCETRLNRALKPTVSPTGIPTMKDLGFESVELDLETSTAYIRSRGSWQANQEAFSTAANAMGLASHAKYVIIDIRDNPGGSGEMGRFLASYFFPDGEEKYYLYGFGKAAGTGQQEWTYSYVPGIRLPEAKVFILVNQHTGSATEGFAYALQQMKRATVVGQTTAGAGIAGELKPLPNKMSMFLPVKMIVAPDSQQGWEGTGVKPDIVTIPGNERETAMDLIRKDLMAHTTQH